MGGPTLLSEPPIFDLENFPGEKFAAISDLHFYLKFASDKFEDMSKPITKSLSLDKARYYETHLSIINGLLPVRITPKEVEVLARFMSFNGELSEGENRFGTTARKLVKVDLNLSDAGLSNYLKNLTGKGFLFPKEDNPKELMINPILIPDPQVQEYRFLLTNTDKPHD